MNAADWVPIFAQIVALTALLITLITTRLTLTAQRDIKLTELKAELFAKSRQSWIAEFRRMTADLLVLCDPDYCPPSVAEDAARGKNVLKAVHSLSLLLDPHDPDHAAFEKAIIRLSMEAHPRYAEQLSDSGALRASAAVIEAAKGVVKKEMRWLEEQFRSKNA